jgi:hypothetical protein
MTIKQRIASRKRKERNRRIMWYVLDGLGLICLFGIGYGLTLIAYAIQ